MENNKPTPRHEVTPNVKMESAATQAIAKISRTIK